MGFSATDLTPAIGSELALDAAALLRGDYAQDIRNLLVQRGVIIVRGANLDDDQQRAFTRTLGDLRTGTFTKEGNEGLMAVTMDKKENPAYAEFFPGTFFWHLDGTYERVPPFATVLTPRVLSDVGGQTEFANTYAAFEALPQDEQDYLCTLNVVHTMVATMSGATLAPTLENFKLWLSYPTPTYPLVWKHKTGRKSLVLSKSCSHVIGLHPADSRALLDRLIAHATQEKFVYRHVWQMGDLLIWDNTGTMHRVRPYDEHSGRRLHRFTLNGEEALGVDA